ncbi:MAG: hypothetical protein E7463_06990 [Ruminococcaceae bacterium]|nr:hypothetical protein [Oscillospiraceae bacterium]
MIDYARSFMTEIDFGAEATDALCHDLAKILTNPESAAIWQECMHAYKENILLDYAQYLEKAKTAGELANVHMYSAQLLLFVCWSGHLRKLYRENGIADSIWFDCMCDLKWKLWECQAVKGMHGSFVAGWFAGFFNMTRFGFGRLQFEFIELTQTYEVDGLTLSPGDRVINIHIPRTLTPFNPANCDDAFDRAAEFFRPRLDGAPVVFHCSSWILSDIHYKILHEKSNVRRFMDRFNIVSFTHEPEGEHRNAWRIFDMDFTGSYDDYPEDSFIRKAYKDYMKSGGITGTGRGFFVYSK